MHARTVRFEVVEQELALVPDRSSRARTGDPGWNQFGNVGSSATTSTPTATHGAAAARVTGPDTGDWDVSAFWQELDTAPGERWSASVRVWHSPANPLTGQCRAILNIEWRNGAGNLISYESFALADAATPTDVFKKVAVTSQPQRAGFPLTLDIGLPELKQPAWVKISQIRTLSVERVGRRLARLEPGEVAKVIEGLNEILGK